MDCWNVKIARWERGHAGQVCQVGDTGHVGHVGHGGNVHGALNWMVDHWKLVLGR